MSITKLSILALATCLLFPANSVYGHGLGIDTISSVDVAGKEISISVEMPMYFENEQEQITITAIDKETDEHAKNVTFLIGLFHSNEMILETTFLLKMVFCQLLYYLNKDMIIL